MRVRGGHGHLADLRSTTVSLQNQPSSNSSHPLMHKLLKMDYLNCLTFDLCGCINATQCVLPPQNKERAPSFLRLRWVLIFVEAPQSEASGDRRRHSSAPALCPFWSGTTIASDRHTRAFGLGEIVNKLLKGSQTCAKGCSLFPWKHD